MSKSELMFGNSSVILSGSPDAGARVSSRRTAGKAGIQAQQTFSMPSSAPATVSWVHIHLQNLYNSSHPYAHTRTHTGVLHYLQEGGEHVERGKLEGKPLFLCLHPTRPTLAVVTNEMMLTQYSINSLGETSVLMNVR